MREPDRGPGTLRAIKLIWPILIALGATLIAVVAMLAVRRRAPQGGYFENGDRAAGFFGVLTTVSGLLLGFVVFLAFSSYDESRTGAETEALTVAQQYETAQFLGGATAARLGGQLTCYGRYVVNQEWPQMEAGTRPDEVNPWGVAMFRTVQGSEPGTTSAQAAYAKWLDQTSAREAARLDRLHGAEGIIPWPMWVVMFLGALVVFLFMLVFADPAERSFVQGIQVASVVLMMTAVLLVIDFLDHPFQEGPGGLKPVAMERTLSLVQGPLREVGAQAPLPCDIGGLPR